LPERLVLDSKSQPRLCYIHENITNVSGLGGYKSKTSLNYVYWNGSAWLEQVVDSSNNVYYGHYNLKLDFDNEPLVYFYKENYQDTSDSGLKRATLIGLNWNFQTIGLHDFNDIAFDSHGNPHIIYDMWLGGSIRGAPIRSNLTYASLETTLVITPTLLVITIIAVITVVISVGLLVYFRKRKH
jgi:hypothetical protein